MKSRVEHIYETQKIDYVEFNQLKEIEKIEKFFIKNSEMKKNEFLYVIKVFVDSNEEIQTQGIYFANETNPLDMIVNGDNNTDEIVIELASSQDKMLEYINTSKTAEYPENIYIFKVLYRDFKLHKIKSFHYDLYDLDLYLFEKCHKKNGTRGQVMKIFGDRDFLTCINFYPNEYKEVE